MDSELKTEPGSRPSGELGDDEKLINMSIPDLIYELRIATRTKQFDQVEHVLVAREAELKGEANKMRQILELERLERMEIERKLMECQEQCNEMKRGKDLYEKLLANVKKNGLQDTTDEELRTKNSKLEGELKIWKEKLVELKERVSKVEYEAQLLVKERNNVGNFEADIRVTLDVKKEEETDGNHVHGGHSGNNNAGCNVSQRTGAGIGRSSSNPNKDVSESGRSGLKSDIIEISDSDYNDDNDNDKKEGASQFVIDNGHPNSSAATGQQQKISPGKKDVIGMLKRKYVSGKKDSSSDSESSSELKRIVDRVNAHHHTSDRRSKA